ncbi:MAG: SUMF1/EgtB/PvdO family nonheme iron enzyme [Gammaproteobacteria bacterium]|nr:SUMF1/EgtB/PvdO family nonheme iron enzyme [Gammaproteobacteria bacterium]
MNDISHNEETAQLKQRISELESKLQQTQHQLDEYRKHANDTSFEHKIKTRKDQKQLKQNKLFSQFKLCDANWSEIPAGRIESGEIAAFKMLNTPVTFDMFDLYCATTGEQPPGDNGWGRENRPVININYQDALTYSRWLSEQTGWHCQLPSVEQWEYACRAGTVTNYWYGDTPDPRMMVMGTGKTMPSPGTRLANSWELYDMHGNVWEWTSTAKGGEFILCGGSWYNKANWLTSSARNISYPNFSNNNWGFRLIRQKD